MKLESGGIPALQYSARRTVFRSEGDILESLKYSLPFSCFMFAAESGMLSVVNRFLRMGDWRPG